MDFNSDESANPPLSRTEFNDYVVYHAHKLTPKDLRTLNEQLPALRKDFEGVQTPEFPHTPERLAFLADVVEAFVSGTYEHLPFESAAEAAFALIYLHQEIDLIPDSLPGIGFTDDATIVALVLERNAPAFLLFAERTGRDWGKLATIGHTPELP
jgi:uncharacterized membrane protein YkvA (DUF1232 family)